MEDVPVACSLQRGEARRRWEQWAALDRWRRAFEHHPNELRIRYEDSEAVHGLLPRLVEAERACCRFVEWELTDEGPWKVLQVRGGRDGVEAIAAAFRPPGSLDS